MEAGEVGARGLVIHSTVQQWRCQKLHKGGFSVTVCLGG